MATILPEGNTGWACPGCGTCYSPAVMSCSVCIQKPRWLPKPKTEAWSGCMSPGAVGPILPVPVDEPQAAEAIYVPSQDGATPADLRNAQLILNSVALSVVKGKFVVLPPGAMIRPWKVKDEPPVP